MIALVKIISSETESTSLARRILKFFRFGKSDVQTSFEASPYGVDSNPIKDMVAVYAETSEKGKTVLIGYLNKNQMAALGETRIYSTDVSGELKSWCWLKNDGTVQINGTANNAVKYTPLNAGLQNYNTDVNTELAKIAAAITSLGGVYAYAPVVINIDNSKNDLIKTN